MIDHQQNPGFFEIDLVEVELDVECLVPDHLAVEQPARRPRPEHPKNLARRIEVVDMVAPIFLLFIDDTISKNNKMIGPDSERHAELSLDVLSGLTLGSGKQAEGSELGLHDTEVTMVDSRDPVDLGAVPVPCGLPLGRRVGASRRQPVPEGGCQDRPKRIRTSNPAAPRIRHKVSTDGDRRPDS